MLLSDIELLYMKLFMDLGVELIDIVVLDVDFSGLEFGVMVVNSVGIGGVVIKVFVVWFVVVLGIGVLVMSVDLVDWVFLGVDIGIWFVLVIF